MEEKQLLVTGNYRTWASFAGLFGKNAVWQRWTQECDKLEDAGEALGALRSDRGAVSIRRALKKTSSLYGVGADYLGPHCIRSWVAVLDVESGSAQASGSAQTASSGCAQTAGSA
jgi:hypothetical protein